MIEDSGPWRKFEFDQRALDAADTITLRDSMLASDLRIDERTKSDGYNPYESFPNTSSATGIRKHQDLRRLSEWIRARRQAESARSGDALEATSDNAITGVLKIFRKK